MEILEIELFKNLSEIQIGDKYLDLHNNYQCYQITLDHSIERNLILYFISDNLSKIRLIFKNIEVIELSFNFDIPNRYLTLDNIYRGRYEFEGVLLEEIDKKGVIYIDFYEQKNLIIKSSELSIELVAPAGGVYHWNET